MDKTGWLWEAPLFCAAKREVMTLKKIVFVTF